MASSDQKLEKKKIVLDRIQRVNFYMIFVSRRRELANIRTLCAIWYHLQNLKNVKNTHGGCFPRFLNFADGKKSRKASHIKKLLDINPYS